MIKQKSLLILCAVAFTLLIVSSHVRAARQTDKELGGTVTATVDGKELRFPALKTDVITDIQGDLATVTVVQTFANPTTAPLNATYLFPLNKDAAVYAMRMEVGDEIVTAKIKKKEEARRTFEKAKTEGRAAALLVQRRPNMFTQDIANLMPGLPVKVTLKYTHAVQRVDGAYELVVPLVVGPRYQPQARGPMVSSDDTRLSGQWRFEAPPAYPHVSGLSIPDTIDRDRVSIRVNIHSALDIKAVTSATHAVITSGAKTARTVKLGKGRTVDNKDFVLRYQLAGRSTEVGMLTHKDERGGFFSLLLEPPRAPSPTDITPREMVFVLDTSGSMSGLPVEASKTFMRHALENLRRDDYFRIIRFSNNASEFTSGPVLATPANVAKGLAYVASLSAGGGTEIPNAIRQAFSVRQADRTMRIVVFLTDGYIGNEAQVLRLISETIGEARIYAFGVGTSVNRYLLAEMARKGRGFARFVDPTEDSHDQAIALAGRLKSPVLTDIRIDWGTLSSLDITPAAIPDLFTGDSIRVQGRYADGGRHTVTIHGRVNGRPARMPVTLDFPAESTGAASAGIPLIWARSRIARLMDSLTTAPHLRGLRQSDDDIEREVTNLGLDYSLATRWTSFVAVSEKIVNTEPETAKSAGVPLHKVAGVTEKAYGRMGGPSQAIPSSQRAFNSFSGGSTPEPGLLGGLAVLTLAGLAGLYRRRRAGS